MSMDVFFAMMIPSVVAYFTIIWASFADMVGILLRVFPIKKVPGGYDAYKKMINSSQFKTHKKKWQKIYSLFPVTYVICHTLIALCTKDGDWISLIVFVVSIYCFGIVGNIDGKQRKEIEKQMRKCEVK